MDSMNKNSFLVSIVVPVYNAEKYITRCVESIVNQTYVNIEILLIDDGSTDNGGCICDTLAKDDVRIRVIHKSNGGVSSARNVGIELCTGDLVMFVDADDTIEDCCVEELCKPFFSNNNDIDISICGYNEFFQKNNSVKTWLPVELKGDIKVDYYALRSYISSPWGIAYRKSIILENKVRFPNMRFGEDQFFNFMYLYWGYRFCFINKALYNYWHHDNESLSTKRELKSYEGFLERLKFEKKLLKKLEIKRDVDILCNHFVVGLAHFAVLDDAKNDYDSFNFRVQQGIGVLDGKFGAVSLKANAMASLIKYKLTFLVYMLYVGRFYLNKYFRSKG
ncbi:glycosyltransferase family 2 protein [Phascolarctobacterium sp.]|uniref:glycosyltransferase family 2 protein n=1 Tax=Phascolarctobacterium sp. TaxID=2049039 RepID=UPI003868FA2C